MDTVRKLILDRLNALELNRKEVSKAMGRNETYLHQFLHRGTPAELHERERSVLADILKVPETELRGPQARALPAAQSTSNEDDQKVIAGTATIPYENEVSNPRMIASADLIGRIDLPVFGTAQGGESGALSISDQAVDYVSRPIALLRVQDGYGIIVAGDSMAPEHKNGSTALVNPHAKPRIGDSCVYRSHRDDGSTLILIKEYRGETETAWKVRQHNPAKDFTLPKKLWQVCHKTVGSYFA